MSRMEYSKAVKTLVSFCIETEDILKLHHFYLQIRPGHQFLTEDRSDFEKI